MADPVPFDEQAAALKLRAKPRPVTQINRRVILGGAAVGAVLLFLAASIALDPPSIQGEEAPRELYNTRNTPKADALATLPSSYDQMDPAPIEPPPTVPSLGPPLSGDLGATVVQTERDWGLSPAPALEPVYDFRPDPETDAERAERIRQAQILQESLESPVFFQIGRTNSTTETAPLQPVDPFAALQQATAAYASGIAQPGTLTGSEPHPQVTKQTFAETTPDGDIYNPHTLIDPVSPYQIMAGTIIPASLITGLNSDLPGTIIAQVTQPVYDTVSGTHLLIPQGARLIGRYDTQVSVGQDRALVIWDRVIFPNGTSIQLEAAPTSDPSGYAGLSDKVDHHWRRVMMAAGLASLLGIGTELTIQNGDAVADAVRESFQDTANQAGQRLVDRNLNIQPTLTVRPGWPLRVIVTRDLILRPYP